MASAPLGAAPANHVLRSNPAIAPAAMIPIHGADLLLAQVTEEELLEDEEEPLDDDEEAPTAEEPPAEEAPPEEAPAEEPPAVEEPPAEEPPAEQPPAQEPQAEEPAAEEAPPAEAPPVEEAPATEEPVLEEPPAEQAPAEEPAAEEPAVEEAPPVEEAPATEEPVLEEPPAEQAPAEEPAAEEPAVEEAPPAEEAPATGEPAVEEPAAEQAPAQDPAAEEPAVQEPPLEEDAAAPPAFVPPAETADQAVPEDAAPIFDSAKEAEQPAADGAAPAEQAQQPAEPAAPPPTSDAAAQAETIMLLQDIQPAAVEQGERIQFEVLQQRQPERPESVQIIQQIDNRTIIEINNQIIVESSDRERVGRDATEVYYEDLPRGRTRETVVRPNGVQVVTVRNAYGDVIRRSRIMPDGREYVLYYVDERDYDYWEDWRDPGLDLPPLRLTIPVNEYILEAALVEDPDVYYSFFMQPPIDRVQRLYSVDEVKRSARVRDMMRRVDLDTITFEFGSASIGESEIVRLEAVADAMIRLLERNPAETFLIEGHTDAVGSDQANLVLSDRRAETVADALTNVFGIPPENLATQGYGERYLKINTQEPERENRRVAMRRITPLVAPIASAN